MRTGSRAGLATLLTLSLALAGCPGGGTPPTTSVSSVGRSVGTLFQTSGFALACGGALQPDPVALFAALPPSNKLYPIAGFELFKPPPCSSARLDAYRGIVTFNMASVAGLKGLVQKAELIVETQALPSGAGRAVTFVPPPALNATCPARFGGAAALQRFGPAAAGTLSQFVSPNGTITDIGATGVFPSGTTVYTFPSSLTLQGGAPLTSVPGATSPTTVTASGSGGVVFATDVTGAVTSALNSSATEMTWMLTSLFETPPPSSLPTGGSLDCKTSYDIRLEVTHF